MSTTISITLNPNNPSDLAEARALLDRLEGTATGSTPDDDVRQQVTAIIRGYGKGRLDYLRAVAEASPGRASYDDVAKLFENPKGIGGTHSSIEKSWRAMGGSGKFIDTDRNGDSLMDPALAEIVLELLDDAQAVK